MADLYKLSSALVVEKQRPLGVGQLGGAQVDFGLDVTVGDEGVEQPIVVVVKEDETEAEKVQAGWSEPRLVGVIRECQGPRPVLLVERQTLAVEVADQHG